MILSLWQEKIRPALEKQPAIALGIVGVGVIAVAFYAWPSLRGGGSSIVIAGNYFTADDGKTVFEDNDPHDLPPFQHDGQEAVQAFFVPGKKVGRADSIWYLSKMTDEHKAQMEAMIANGPGALPTPKAGPASATKPPSIMNGQLIKRPGDADWVPMGDPKSAEIMKLPG